MKQRILKIFGIVITAMFFTQEVYALAPVHQAISQAEIELVAEMFLPAQQPVLSSSGELPIMIQPAVPLASLASGDLSMFTRVAAPQPNRGNAVDLSMFQPAPQPGLSNSVELSVFIPPAASQARLSSSGELPVVKQMPQLPTRIDAVKVFERNYPPLGPRDTVDINSQGLFVSAHGKGKVIRDEEILKVSKIVEEREIAPKVKIQKTENNNWVIQQQATRGCVAAAVDMMLAKYEIMANIERLQNTNLANPQQEEEWLGERGFTVIRKKVTSLDALQHFIEQEGSAILDVSGDIGSHVVVLDYVSQQRGFARIRDPYHGWEIEINLNALRRICPEGFEFVQIKPGKSDACLVRAKPGTAPSFSVETPNLGVSTLVAQLRVAGITVQYGEPTQTAIANNQWTSETQGIISLAFSTSTIAPNIREMVVRYEFIQLMQKKNNLKYKQLSGLQASVFVEEQTIKLFVLGYSQAQINEFIGALEAYTDLSDTTKRAEFERFRRVMQLCNDNRAALNGTEQDWVQDQLVAAKISGTEKFNDDVAYLVNA